MENPYAIEKEKFEWLESINARPFEEPMIYYIWGGFNVKYTFSKEYIVGTPLSKLKRDYEATR